MRSRNLGQMQRDPYKILQLRHCEYILKNGYSSVVARYYFKYFLLT